MRISFHLPVPATPGGGAGKRDRDRGEPPQPMGNRLRSAGEERARLARRRSALSGRMPWRFCRSMAYRNKRAHGAPPTVISEVSAGCLIPSRRGTSLPPAVFSLDVKLRFRSAAVSLTIN